MGSPLTARILRLVADRLIPGRALADRLFGWTGGQMLRADAVPLRLAAGLHALALSGQDTALAAACHVPGTIDDEAL